MRPPSSLLQGTMDGLRAGGCVGLALQGPLRMETLVSQGCRPLCPGTYTVTRAHKSLVLEASPPWPFPRLFPPTSPGHCAFLGRRCLMNPAGRCACFLRGAAAWRHLWPLGALPWSATARPLPGPCCIA